MADAPSLFPASLIPREVVDTCPSGFTIRPLERRDYGKGFFDCLRVLTWVGEVTEAEFLERFDEMAAAKDTYYFLVLEYDGRIVGTGALVVEKKFIHNRGKCGHVEEISIAREHQGRGLGLKMIRALDALAASLGCYKNILNCGPKNEPFYVKCGYDNSGIEMSHYFEKGTDAYHRG
ncbi:acyl-CoA N-acyltransferase [Xylariomycetidae sp. FL2044]|nr:acyl-CoA N-acyltransferase [Xylariomycetidae sp. FL2044]